jgi:hypothetical protein
VTEAEAVGCRTEGEEEEGAGCHSMGGEVSSFGFVLGEGSVLIGGAVIWERYGGKRRRRQRSY